MPIGCMQMAFQRRACIHSIEPGPDQQHNRGRKYLFFVLACVTKGCGVCKSSRPQDASGAPWLGARKTLRGKPGASKKARAASTGDKQMQVRTIVVSMRGAGPRQPQRAQLILQALVCEASLWQPAYMGLSAEYNSSDSPTTAAAARHARPQWCMHARTRTKQARDHAWVLEYARRSSRSSAACTGPSGGPYARMCVRHHRKGAHQPAHLTCSTARQFPTGRSTHCLPAWCNHHEFDILRPITRCPPKLPAWCHVIIVRTALTGSGGELGFRGTRR